MDLTPENVLRNLWRHADKHERLRAFDHLDRLTTFSDQMFWSTLWEIWANHESIYRDGDVVQRLFASRPSSDPHIGLSDEDAGAYDALPALLRVYRGCGADNQVGWSWTLDREVAVRFAERSARGGAPLLVRGTVQKAVALAYLTGRNEAEVVVNSDLVMNKTVDRLSAPSRAISSRSAIFQMSQEGFFETPEVRRMKAELIFKSVASSQEGIEQVRRIVSEALPFCRALSLEKTDFLSRLEELLGEHLGCQDDMMLST